MEEEKGIQSPMIMKFGKHYGKTCGWVYSRDRDYCDWVIRLDASNKNLLQFQEFVRAAERRDTWKELEMREKTLEENRKRREEKRAIEEKREVMTRMRKNIEAPAEVDAMAAAETDAMAAAGTNTMAAAENETTAVTVGREQGTKTTEVREERGWKDDVWWRHTWVRQAEYWNDPNWNKRSAIESPAWCETKDIRQLKPGKTVWHVICTSEEEGVREQEEEGAVMSPPGIETHRHECEVRRLNERIRRIEDRIEEWNWGGRGVNHAKEEGNGASWERDDWRVGGWGGWHQWDREWAQWDGEWWVKVGRSSLNARQRRRISRDLRRLIAREQNEVLKLSREMRSALWRGNGSMDACERSARGGRSSDGEMEKTRGGDDDDDETGSRGGKQSWEVERSR